jgi:hypothetical protein
VLRDQDLGLSRLAVFLLFLVGSNAAAQDRSGTVIILAGSQSEIVMAADSRKTTNGLNI